MSKCKKDTERDEEVGQKDRRARERARRGDRYEGEVIQLLSNLEATLLASIEAWVAKSREIPHSQCSRSLCLLTIEQR